MPAKSYTPFSTFWGLFIPVVLIGLMMWGYNQPGYVGNRFHQWFGPIVEPISKWLTRAF